MIAQVLANAREIVDHWHPDTLELRSGPTPESRSTWGEPMAPPLNTICSPVHRKALATAFDLDPNGACAVKQEAPHHDVALDGEVEPVARRVKIGEGHADAYPINRIARPG